MDSSKMLTPRNNLLLSGLFLCIGWLVAHAGIMPILGVMVALFAPDLFLIGLVFLSIWIAEKLSIRKLAIVLLATILSIVLGLNTRLPALLSDSVSRTSELYVTSHLEATVGQPIHIIAQPSEILARRNSFSHAIPACYGDGCLATKGFRTPYTGVEREYWHENVTNVALDIGFSIAKQDEIAPTIAIKQETEEYFSNVHIELMDSNGKLLSRYDGRYRNGFPFETKDDVKYDGIKAESLVLQYLLHGNIMNSFLARLLPTAKTYPLASFLKATTKLQHPQGSTLGLIFGRPPVGSEPPSTKVTLEIIEEKTYDPVWTVKPDPQSDVSKWNELTWDKERGDRCKELLKPETGAPQMQTWQLFVNDPTGRKKARYTGDAFCDPDAIWFLDYVIEKNRTTLTKYSVAGDFLYRVSFEKPKEPYGYAGFILIPSFKLKNGYILFDWWNVNSAAGNMLVKRSMKVRFKEPISVNNSVVNSSTSQAPSP